MLILNDLTPMHWAVAGAGVALITLAMLWATNRRLGISTSFESVCSLASDLPYFRRPALHGPGRWRLWFAVGLVAGGFASALLGGGWSPTWDVGMLDEAVALGQLGKLAWMFAGGLLVGFGTRTAQGCTSGHGIFGFSNLERASVVSVVSFMAAAVLTSNVIFRVLF